MRLSLVLMFKRTVNGHIFRGKKRLVKPVSLQSMATLIKQYELEEQNMLLLRHPYLTVEESCGHMKQADTHGKFIQKHLDAKTMKLLKPHVTIEERLATLKTQEAWD